MEIICYSKSFYIWRVFITKYYFTVLENQVKSKIYFNLQKVKKGKNQDEILTDTMDNQNHNTTYDVDFGDESIIYKD